MDYLIRRGRALWAAPVSDDEATFLRTRVLPKLRPLPDAEYLTGPIGLLNLVGRASYVLDGDALLWCVARPDELIVVRFAPAGLEVARVRRAPAEDPNHDPHDHVVDDPWDAERGEEELPGLTRADAATRRRFDAALRRANELGEELQHSLPDADARRAWLERCRQWLEG